MLPVSFEGRDAVAIHLDHAQSLEALALQADTIRDHDLGIWLTTFQAGQKIATKRKEVMSWKHVIAANAAFINLAGEGK